MARMWFQNNEWCNVLFKQDLFGLDSAVSSFVLPIPDCHLKLSLSWCFEIFVNKTLHTPIKVRLCSNNLRKKCVIPGYIVTLSHLCSDESIRKPRRYLLLYISQVVRSYQYILPQYPQ